MNKQTLFQTILLIAVVAPSVSFVNLNDELNESFASYQTKVEEFNEDLTSLGTKVDMIREEQLRRTKNVYSVEVLQNALTSVEVENSYLCMMRVAKNGVITDCSAGIANITGYNKIEIINQDIGLFMNEDLRTKHEDLLRGKFDDTILSDRPVKILNKSGNYVEIKLSITKLSEFYIVTMRNV